LFSLLATQNSYALLAARLALAVVFFPHGAQKALGWFGGQGLSATVAAMSANLPEPAVYLVIAAEFLGSLGLLVGFLSRLAALGILAVMLGAVFIVHLPHGFFMNWYGKQQGEGIEFHLLAIGLALAVLIAGGGALSIDRALTQRGKTAGSA
jgi:putative oxidoreductase